MKADIAYKGALDICNTHAERLNWAMAELKPHFPLTPAKLAQLTPLELAIFDQFIVRFSKLQDAMGAKLLPAVLDLTQEQGELSAFIDKLNRLEKIGAIESANEWLQLREMRNQFAHDYPEDSDIQASLLNKAFGLSERMLVILKGVSDFAERYQQ
ncbi:hypothetical protein ABIE61_000826 [Marinobacterium sp. MBR-111]|uniref:hypothetical protein n=1 Tax=Marinobacterium sp. MBR-111 TaxID=3156463 RepID=UPI00339913FE